MSELADPQPGQTMPAEGGSSPGLVAVRAFESRCDAIAVRLKSVDSPAAKAAVRQEIIDLFREVDEVHARVAEVRERIRGLVTAYKELVGGAAGRRPPVYHDRLNSSSFVERGWNLIAAEKYPEAVAALEKALALAPENTEAEGMLGWALMKMGSFDRALACLQRVLVADPQNAMARANLGYVCFRRQIYGEALQHLSAAIEPGDKKATMYAYVYLGELQTELGKVEEALDSYKRAIEAGPGLIEAYYHMGLLLYREQRLDQARAVWQSAVERSPYNPYAKKARALLEDLAAGRPVAAG